MKGKFLHHLPYIAFLPSGILMLYLIQISGSSVWINIASVAVILPFVGAAAVGFFEHQFGHCGGCPARTPEQYRSLHLRAWNFLGRFSMVAILIVFFGGFFLLAVFSDSSGDGFNFMVFAVTSSTVVFLSLCLASFLFHLANREVYGRGTSRAGLWVSEIFRRTGHHLIKVGSVLFAMTTVVYLLMPRSDARSIATALLICAIFGVWAGYYRHALSLCEQCAVDLPVDAPGYAQRRKVFFTAAHRYTLLISAFGIVCVFTGMVVGESVITDVLTGVNLITLAVSTLISRFHSRYQPWCPICHPGRGNGGAHDEVPDPTSGHGKPLPV